MRVGLFLLLLLALSFPASCLDVADATQTVLSEEGINIVLAMMFIAMLIIGAFMVGRTTNNPGYIVFAKDEAYHLGFSLVALVSIGAVLSFSCFTMDMFYTSLFNEMSEELSAGCYIEGIGMSEVATCYMNHAKADATRLSQGYIKGYISELMDSTFAWTIQIPLLTSYTSTAEAYRRVVSNQYDIILNSFLIPALMSISMQKLMLNFISENALRWILPSAFLLRIFIPTRALGNMLIALVIALYVVVPFMYVFNFAMYDTMSSECVKTVPKALAGSYASAVCDNVVDDYDCANTCTNPLGFWSVARLIPQAFFLPNLTIAVVITFLGSMNKALRVIG